MGNTLRRPRKRPRVRSVNFRALWWLAAREAAYCILTKPGPPGAYEELRASFARGRSTELARRCEFVCKYWPHRRYFP